MSDVDKLIISVIVPITIEVETTGERLTLEQFKDELLAALALSSLAHRAANEAYDRVERRRAATPGISQYELRAHEWECAEACRWHEAAHMRFDDLRRGYNQYMVALAVQREIASAARGVVRR